MCFLSDFSNEKQLSLTVVYKIFLRMAASYTSKEAADHEEPEIDLARIPSDDHHRMGDGNLHAVQVIS